MPANSYIVARDPGETKAEWIARLRLALDHCRAELVATTMTNHLALGELARVTRISETQATDDWGHAHKSSPFIRQHNALSKMIADLITAGPGPEQALVRRLASILDMELPDPWRASPG